MKRSATWAAAIALLVFGAGLTGSPAGATVNGTNGRIAYSRFNRSFSHAVIVSANPDGTGVAKLTITPVGTFDSNPDWSPDGTKIAFQRETTDSQEIYTMNADGSGLRQITFDGTLPGNADPAWSPDGSKIAVERFDFPAGRDGLFYMNTDGSHIVQVTQTDARGENTEPQWSPDGKKLVFDIASDTRGHAIFTVRLDGTGEHRITPWSLDALHPDWSPDGRLIVFEAPDADDAPPGTSANVYTICQNGRHLTEVTHNQGGALSATNPAWSPNGRKIVFVQNPGSGPFGYADVFRMNADGSAIRHVSRSKLWEFRPDWGTTPTI